MEVCVQDEVEPEGPLVSGQGDSQGATVVPIGVKEEGVAGSFSDTDVITATELAKKRRSSGKSVVSSSSDEGSSAISSSCGSAKGSTQRTGKKVRRRRRKRGLGDTQSSSAPAGLLVDKNNNNADHHGGDDDVSPSRGATALDQSDSAPVPTVCEVAEDHNHSSSSSSSTSLGRRNSAPEVAKQETKRVSIPLLGRRLRLDIKFGHEIVHKEPKADVEHHSKGEEAEKNPVNGSAPAAVEKESQVQAKQHDTNDEGAHHHHNHHNPFHFLSNLFHHHHHHHHHHHQHTSQAAMAQKGSMSNEHPVVPQTHSVAPKVEVMA